LGGWFIAIRKLGNATVTFRYPFALRGDEWLPPGTYDLLIDDPAAEGDDAEFVFRISLIQHLPTGRSELRLLDPGALVSALSRDRARAGAPLHDSAGDGPQET